MNGLVGVGDEEDEDGAGDDDDDDDDDWGWCGCGGLRGLEWVVGGCLLSFLGVWWNSAAANSQARHSSWIGVSAPSWADTKFIWGRGEVRGEGMFG